MTVRIADLPAILFVPGNRPERFAKALASGAPAIVIDLEDAVAPEAKDAARAGVHGWFAARVPGPVAAGIRINVPFNRHGLADLARFLDGSVRPDFILMPKVESATEALLLHRLSEGVPLICTIESALGLARAMEIAQAAPSVAALAFGGADLSADLRASLEWEPMLHARGTLVQAAAAAGIGLLDVPYLNLADASLLEAECRRARAMGFTGKLAIHPAHIKGILAAFLPSPAEAERARRMLATAEAAAGNAASFEGKMIDEALLRAARRVIALAEAAA